MNHLNLDSLAGHPSPSPQDPRTATAMLIAQLGELDDQLAQLPADTTDFERNRLLLLSCYTLIELERGGDAWARARRLLEPAVEREDWLQAVEICDVLYQAEQPESLKALAHGIWLAVTYPIDPELSLAMLQHLVEETPDHSDGGAVAAAVASYLVDIRTTGEQHAKLHFFTTQLLGKVAARHSKVDDGEVFAFWVEQLGLNDPAKLLPRLASIIDVLAEDDWWFDRDLLRSRIPD